MEGIGYIEGVRSTSEAPWLCRTQIAAAAYIEGYWNSPAVHFQAGLRC